MNLPSFNKLKAKNKIFYLIVIFIFFTFLISYFIIYQSIVRIIFLSDEIIASKINQIKSEGQNFEENIMLKKISQVEIDLEKIKNIYVNINKELEFITTLEDIARKNNIKQKINLNQKQAQKVNNYQIIPIRLDSQGNFNDLLNYLAELETMQYFIIIANLEITKSASFSNTNQINFLILADTYWKNIYE
jgi:hypothetical protein